MRCYGLFLLAAVVVCSTTGANGARILGLFHFHGRSHFIMFEALMKGLAAKGHDVTVVSHFPQKTPLPNYRDLSVKGSLPSVINNFTVEFVRNFKYFNLVTFIWTMSVDFCTTVLDHPVFQDLLKSQEKYDLIITEIFGVDCCLGFAHKFNTPIISMVSSVGLPWSHDRIGNVDNPSYIPNYFLQYNARMTLTERFVNTVFYTVTTLGQYYYAHIPTEKLLRKHHGDDLPPLSELAHRTSIVFVNSHFSLHAPRPTVPAYVEVGGIHIPPAQKLPADLEKFIKESPHGVIYFSFGSLVKAETLPQTYIRAFVDAFSELPQRILWKCDAAAMPKLPANIKTATWLPQVDILSHPNVLVFITHGGLMGSQEGVHTGVPMVGIPLFSDQLQNINLLVQHGVAVLLEYDTISKENVLQAIRAVTQNKSYRENMQRLSRQFRDRPQTALQTAVFWTEYVIRHGGAPHLRSAAMDLAWYQYLLLDVLAVLLLAVLIVLTIIWFVIKKTVSLLRPKQKANKTTSKSKLKAN